MNNSKTIELNLFIREIFNSKEQIPLHTPSFIGNEKKY